MKTLRLLLLALLLPMLSAWAQPAAPQLAAPGCHAQQSDCAPAQKGQACQALLCALPAAAILPQPQGVPALPGIARVLVPAGHWPVSERAIPPPSRPPIAKSLT